MTLQERLWKKPWKDLTTGQKWGRVGLWFVVTLIPLSVAGGVVGAYFAGHANGYDKAVNVLSLVPDAEDFASGTQAYVAPLPSQENFVVSEQNGAANFGKAWADAVNAGNATQEDFNSALANSSLPDDFKNIARESFNANLTNGSEIKEGENKPQNPGDEGQKTPEDSSQPVAEEDNTNVPNIDGAKSNSEFVVTVDGVTFNYSNGVLSSVTMQDDLGRTITASVVNGKVAADDVAESVSSVTGTKVSSNNDGVSTLTSTINEKIKQINKNNAAQQSNSSTDKAEARATFGDGPLL